MQISRKKPTGENYRLMVEGYKAANHEGKVFLAGTYDVSLDTMKHWVSDGDTVPTGFINMPTVATDYVGIAEPLNLNIMDEPVTVAIINDTHNPYQDDEAVALVEKLLVELQPEYLIYAGDMNDFYQLSSFDKDPKRATNMQADIDSTKAMFARHAEILPKTKKKLLVGTHEDRLRRFLWSRAPAMETLKALELEELYNLNALDIPLVPYEQGLLINGVFLVLHGDIASQDSSATAKNLSKKHGGSGMAGHCHRMGSYFKRDRFGVYGWWENGCLCKLDPDWIKNPNWQQGFSLVHFKGKRFWVEQVPIIDKALMYGGRVISL